MFHIFFLNFFCPVTCSLPHLTVDTIPLPTSASRETLPSRSFLTRTADSVRTVTWPALTAVKVTSSEAVTDTWEHSMAERATDPADRTSTSETHAHTSVNCILLTFLHHAVRWFSLSFLHHAWKWPHKRKVNSAVPTNHIFSVRQGKLKSKTVLISTVKGRMVIGVESPRLF